MAARKKTTTKKKTAKKAPARKATAKKAPAKKKAPARKKAASKAPRKRAAKGAIESVTKTAAREFTSYRVRVNAIAPGPVNTPMLAGVGEEGIAAFGRSTLVGRIAEPDELAATVAAIADPKLFGYTTGQVFHANGGMYRA